MCLKEVTRLSLLKLSQIEVMEALWLVVLVGSRLP